MRAEFKGPASYECPDDSVGDTGGWDVRLTLDALVIGALRLEREKAALALGDAEMRRLEVLASREKAGEMPKPPRAQR